MLSGRTLMIATPCYSGLSVNYVASLVETLAALREAGVSTRCVFKHGNALLPVARNHLADDFLASDCTDLLMIDADMGWRPDAVIRLLEAPQGVVAAVGHRKRSGPDSQLDLWCCNFMVGSGGGLSVGDNGCIEVGDVGTGFLRVRRQALDWIVKERPDLRRAYRNLDTPEGRTHYYKFFAITDDDGAEWAEDYSFCKLWRALGGKVWIDPQIRLTHVGTRVFEGDIRALFTVGT